MEGRSEQVAIRMVPIEGMMTLEEARKCLNPELFIDADALLHDTSFSFDTILNMFGTHSRVIFFKGVGDGFARVVELIEDMIYASDQDLSNTCRRGDAIAVRGEILQV